MRILVVSDVHANLRALDAVIQAAGAVDATWHLGDIVGYGPDPDAVVARLRDLGATGVRGNHDAAALGGSEIELFNTDARRAMEWTKSVISAETRDWLEGQPLRHTDGRFSLTHGSPRDPTWEYILSASIARANIAMLDTQIGLFGHTHLPVVYRSRDSVVETGGPPDATRVALDDRRTLLNPGSVGQPRDGDARASFLVLDTATDEAIWTRVRYDIAGTQAAMQEAGLPERLVARLAYGL